MATLHKIDPGFRLAARGSGIELDIYDVIGDGMFGGVSARTVSDALKDYKDADSITVNLNSPGGDAFDGITIYNVLKRHKAKVTVNIDGLAASAASVIAMAGDEIHMAENAQMMIHNAWTMTMGDVGELTKTLDRLAKTDNQIAATYAKRTGGDIDTIKEQMADETWFTAEEALADGFATHITESKRIAACFSPRIFDKFAHVPDSVREAFTTPAADDAAEPINHIGDKTMPEITPETFASANPDAVAGWKAEAGVEARNDELARVKALGEAFPDDPAFALDQATKGHDVPKAKAEYADILAEKNKRLAAENDELKKQKADDEDGQDPVNLAAPKPEQPEDKYAGLSVGERIQAEWDDDLNGCQKTYSHISGYKIAREKKLTA